MAAHIPKELNWLALGPYSESGEGKAATTKEQYNNAETIVMKTTAFFFFSILLK